MLKRNLEQREQPECTAIIRYMPRQELEVQWLLTTQLPTALSLKASIGIPLMRRSDHLIWTIADLAAPV